MLEIFLGTVQSHVDRFPPCFWSIIHLVISLSARKQQIKRTKLFPYSQTLLLLIFMTVAFMMKLGTMKRPLATFLHRPVG